MNLPQSGRRALSDLVSLLKNLAVFFGFVLGVAALGFALVYPLWYFSSHHRQGYTVFVLLILLGFLIAFALRSFLSSRKGGFNFVPKLLGAIRVLGSLTALYGIILLYSRGLLIAAIPLSVIFLALLGYQKYGR